MEVDEARLRDFVESEAIKDAASDMYDVNLGAHGHPLIMENNIARWNHRWSAEAEIRQHKDRRSARLFHRAAIRERTAGEQALNLLEQDLQDACSYHERMQRVVDAAEPSDDGGYWPAQTGSMRTGARSACSGWSTPLNRATTGDTGPRRAGSMRTGARSA